jgi:hypothetical protein
MENIRQIFLPLERTYMLKSDKLKTIWKMGLHLLLTNIQLKVTVLDQMIFSLLKEIKEERLGAKKDTNLFNYLIQMCLALDIYK